MLLGRVIVKTNHRRRVQKRQKGSKGPGHELWSRRPAKGGLKSATRAIERRQAKEATREELDSLGEYWSQF